MIDVLQQQKKNEAVKAAMKIVTEAIKDDPGYKEAWRSNIAMAFQDAHAHFCRDNPVPLTTKNIWSISNTAAENFLATLVK